MKAINWNGPTWRATSEIAGHERQVRMTQRVYSANEVADYLVEKPAYTAVEYWRGSADSFMRKCSYGGDLWSMALAGNVLLAQKRYGDNDYGYWAIKPRFRNPLVRLASFGRDARGRSRIGETDGRPGENPADASA